MNIIKSFDATFYVGIDGKHYKVIYRSLANPEYRWTVISSKNNYTCYCDQDKPTHQRVVAALHELLRDFGRKQQNA